MSDLISRQAVEEMIKAEMPERGMWEIEGDKEKETVCEVCVDLMQKLSDLPSVENKGEWIPVTERLPKDGQSVLFCDIDDDIMVGYHVKGRPATHFSQDGTYEDMKNVRAWQPLPEPYKAESKDPNDLTHIFDGVTEIPKDIFNGWYTEKMLEQTRAESEDKE